MKKLQITAKAKEKAVEEGLKYYVIRDLINGFVTISRHNKPDFMCGLTDNFIKKRYKIKEIWI